MARLAIYVIGPPRVEVDGVRVALERSKALALLAYLAMSPREQPRAALAALLWPDYDRPRSQAYLRRTLFALKEGLGEGSILSEGDALRLDERAGAWLDAAEFRRNLEAARAHEQTHPALPKSSRAPGDFGPACAICTRLLAAAVDLHRGDFLAGFNLPDSPAFDDWQLFQAEALRRELGETLERLADLHAAAGAYSDAIGAARRWLSLDSFHEPAHRSLMLLYALAGQRAEALRQYDRCVRILADEIGAAPEPATTALYDRIREGRILPPAREAVAGRPPFGGALASEASVDAERQARSEPQAARAERDDGRRPVAARGAADALAPHSVAPDASAPAASGAAAARRLPPQAAPLVGREQELAAIASLLADPECRLLTITGPGGVGKTRLAVEVAKRQCPLFADGAMFVPLAAVNSPGFLLSAIASVLGLPTQGRASPQARLLELLAGQELLLVLDNFEHLIDGGSLLGTILDAAPGVRLLVTSRARLDLSAEWLYPLEGLPYPGDDIATEALGTYPAFRLFVQSARRARADFTLGAGDAAAVARLCRLVDGLPLAIDLAAAWVRLLSPGEIAEEVARRFDVLAGSGRDLPERHRSLRTVFDRSWELLNPVEQEVFRKLSAFRGGFTREAAERVAGASLQVLASLVDQSLVRRSGPARYDLHELLRQYAGERLAEADELERTRTRHLQYFVAFAEAASQALMGRGQQAWFARLAAERDNIRAALTWALDSGAVVEALRVAGSVSEIWYGSGIEEGRAWTEAALKLDRSTASEAQPDGGEDEERSRARGCALLTAGEMARVQGDFPAATAWLEEAEALYRRLGDDAGLARALVGQGAVAEWGQADYARARALQQEAVRLLRGTGQTWGLALALDCLAGALLGLGEVDVARATFEESLALFDGLGENSYVTWPLLGLGAIGLRTGDFERAEFYYGRTHAFSREIGDTGTEAWSLALLGAVALKQGDSARAEARFREALACIGPVGWRLVVYDAFMGLAACAALQSRAVRAARLFGAASILWATVPVPSEGYREAEKLLPPARAALGETAFAALAEAARARPLAELFAYAVGDED